jgi:hypothetical protein
LFTFTLVSSSGDASFLSYPVQWLTPKSSTDDTLIPDIPPPAFLVHSIDPQHFSFWNFNSAPWGMNHHFYLLVYHDKMVYSGDPVIINMPPDSGGA